MNLIFSFLVLLVTNSKDIFSPPVRCRSFASWLAALLPHLPDTPVQNPLNKDAGEGLLISATPTGRSRIKMPNFDAALSRCVKMHELPTPEDAVGVSSPSPLGEGRGEAHFHAPMPRPSQRDISPQSASP